MAESDRNPHTKEYNAFVQILMSNVLFLFWFNALLDFAPKFDDPPITSDPRKEAARQHVLDMQKKFIEYGGASSYTQIWLEISVTRRVDAFLYYISQMLVQVYTQRPERLKSDKQVTIREVMESVSLEEFTYRLIDTTVTELSFKGFQQLIAYLNKTLNLEFPTTTSQYRDTVEWIEVRNIIVHNQGRVSTLFLQRTGRTDLKVNDLFPLTPDYVTRNGNVLLELATALDTQFIRKLGLRHVGG